MNAHARRKSRPQVIELAPGDSAELPDDDDGAADLTHAMNVSGTPTKAGDPFRTPTKSPLRQPVPTVSAPATPATPAGLQRTPTLVAQQGGITTPNTPATPTTPTTPRAVGVGAGEGGRRLVARAREMQYNAGVLKTFDEIIVNAVDRQNEVESMREIRVRIDAQTGELEVWNDGPGIAPVPHKSGKGLVPEVAFGEFMASTNFDDNTRKRFTGRRVLDCGAAWVCFCCAASCKSCHTAVLSPPLSDSTRVRVPGGRFGVGAKATNAWSTSFEVATLHAESGSTYSQTWTNNMATKSEPRVTSGQIPK